MPIAEAKKLGAMALFGEKYGDTVRVVSAGDFSVEFCGGTHTDNAAKIGLFKITSESSVAAGVRRITAVTGTGVLEVLEGFKNTVYEVAAQMKLANVNDVVLKAGQLNAELKEKDKQIAALETKLALGKVDDLIASAVEVKDFKVIAKVIEGMDANSGRSLADIIKSKDQAAVVVLGLKNADKLTFVAACGKAAVAGGAHAGNIVREVAKLAGGNGGGKPDSAMAGGKDISKANDAIAAVVDIVSK